MSQECFADEIAIDFPSVGTVVERMRDAFLGVELEAEAEIVCADVSLTRREASDGMIVPLEVPIRATCPDCGGRGETWTEPCGDCGGTGESVFRHAVRVALPAGVANGARFRFRVITPDAPAVRVEVRVSVRSAAV
jgi:hypothetical protein